MIGQSVAFEVTVQALGNYDYPVSVDMRISPSFGFYGSDSGFLYRSVPETLRVTAFNIQAGHYSVTVSASGSKLSGTIAAGSFTIR